MLVVLRWYSIVSSCCSIVALHLFDRMCFLPFKGSNPSLTRGLASPPGGHSSHLIIFMISTRWVKWASLMSSHREAAPPCGGDGVDGRQIAVMNKLVGGSPRPVRGGGEKAMI